ncbi:hypothetical protein AAIR98_001831 [Elusimicrobium simillimum]|uniref:polyphenol oxidase family protein n=1 Tax=Elusimicrobium simillimum TaxID=3143438 RepID=UPI003C6FCC71
MEIFSDERLQALGVMNGTASRDFGNMREYKNQDAFFERIGLPPQNFVKFKQVHGTKIVTVDTDEDFNNYTQNLVEADGWILSRPRTGAVILTADCVPLYMWDENAKNVGLIHAGWRGVAAGMPKLLAEKLLERGAKKLYAFAGPHIQSCCFEVQNDIVGNFNPASVEERNGKIYVNLRTEIRLQLAGFNIDQMDVHTPCFCTCHNPDVFFSYRRDHTKDCIMSFIYKLG